MRLGRRVLVCLLVLVFVGEASGVARAFGPGSTVHCCCGSHASARPCPCPDCPVTLRHAAPHDLGDARFARARDCDGAGPGDPGVLRVLAINASAPLAVAALAPIGRVSLPAPSPLGTRAVDIGRPPP